MSPLLQSLAKFSLLILLIVVPIIILIFILVKVHRIKHEDLTKKALKTVQKKDRRLVSLRFLELRLKNTRTSGFNLEEYDNAKERAVNFQNEYPEFISVLTSENDEDQKARAKSENRLTIIGIVLAAIIIISAYLVNAKYIEKIDVLNPNPIANFEKQSIEVASQIDVIDRLIKTIEDSDSVTEINNATKQLPYELAKLNDMLEEQKAINSQILEEVKIQRLELEQARKRQSLLSNLSEEELSAFKFIIFEESRSSAFLTFWIGVGFALLIQILITVFQPILHGLLLRWRPWQTATLKIRSLEDKL